MLIREATIDDIPQMQRIRNSVKENQLSDPALVPDKDYVEYLTQRGKGWLAVTGEQVAGFAVADLLENNIWALFVDPHFEKQGIGRKLHDTMLDWYFSQTSATVWLGTAPGTRAEAFYRKAGWEPCGWHGKKELKFEMQKASWMRNR
ncbi:MAG: GNAT family N-acetyltransferase [Ferruginibacter sp.]